MIRSRTSSSATSRSWRWNSRRASEEAIVGDRYRFTREDIEKHLGNIIQRPDAQRLLERVIPVKRFNRPPAALEQVPEDLPVKVRSRNDPDGVPLEEVAKLVKERVPGVRSVMVRDGRVIVAYEKKPTPELRDQLTKLA